MLDPSQLLSGAGPAPAGPGGPGGPPQSIQIPHPQGGGDKDQGAEDAVKSALQRWLSEADDPQEHAFAAKLYQQVTQFIAKEQDDIHNAMGMTGTLKKIARSQGR